jgi:hypothetical protein
MAFDWPVPSVVAVKSSEYHSQAHQLHIPGGDSLREKFDTMIVGGGQAGLAMRHHLRQRGREHIILERRRVAERWRTERWDSLRFQLASAWLTLPGKLYALAK